MIFIARKHHTFGEVLLCNPDLTTMTFNSRESAQNYLLSIGESWEELKEYSFYDENEIKRLKESYRIIK